MDHPVSPIAMVVSIILTPIVVSETRASKIFELDVLFVSVVKSINVYGLFAKEINNLPSVTLTILFFLCFFKVN